MKNPDQHHIKLSPDELEILQGAQGPTLQRVMESVVLYGEALGAECLVDIDGPGHFVIPWSIAGISPSIEMLEELVAAGLKTKYPFTLDPTPPLDFDNLNLAPEVEHAILEMFTDQRHYDELMMSLGLRDKDAYTCYPYLPEVGNIPHKGMILAWSESACAIFANSVLGARTNRNGAIMDLLQNIIGKTPKAGLLTDEGRRADWLIEIRMDNLPNPQILGAVIGLKINSGVPYIIGLNRFLKDTSDPRTMDYLQEMGAMLATYSAVTLFHVENISPEAVDQGRSLLVEDYNTYLIDASELDRLLNSFPVLWDDPEATPEMCYLGCPHLSLRQLYWWVDEIDKEMHIQGTKHLAVETLMCAAPQVLARFKSDQGRYNRMLHAGVRFSTTCSETIFETGLCNGKPLITNSNKLRAYTSAKFFPEEELVNILVSGEVKRSS